MSHSEAGTCATVARAADGHYMHFDTIAHITSARVEWLDVRNFPAALRNLLILGALASLAILLTVPWTYWVIQAAYDRDITQNAQMLARRVEALIASPGDQRNAVREALRAEIISDPVVALIVFYDVTTPERVAGVVLSRDQKVTVPRFSSQRLQELAHRGIDRSEDADTFNITVPWMRDNRPLGITYIELSRDALRGDFWVKEGPLLKRVLALTATAITLLTFAGAITYRMSRRVGRVRESAQLRQEGLLAERGLTAAVLAHEIRNPLAALRFQLHSLRRSSHESGRVLETADTIDSELLRIQKLVTDYLEHERAVTLRVSTVDLEVEARKLQTVVAELLKSTDTRLVLAHPPTPVQVLCDPNALRQVLLNLVINAQQAMMRGGTITIDISRDATNGHICVSDTGPGIPDDVRDQLFIPFKTTKAEGTGLGLALVKRFADNFGGSVTVNSSQQGARFRLELPLAGVAHPTQRLVADVILPATQEAQPNEG